MAAVVQWWDHIIEEYSDPRVEDWPLMQTPKTGTLLVVLYLLIVWIGPKLMANREPFNLKPLLIVYNFAMVALSFYMFWEFFFILRKKNRQVSFLHVFHHALMPFSWWIGVKFVPGGFGTFHAMQNSLIHVMMYCYYGLAALGPSMQKYLWWKKYMTTMQLIQFFLVMVHCTNFFRYDCPYPKVFVYIVGSYGFIFFFLFLNFYIQAYRKSGPKSETKNGHHANGVYDKNNHKKSH
ncbi:putative elongation of very long chain fatty acids protein 7 [Apostichopus japonicus]|uniref:Elongation of very long chain fatty acids protein n=1 Tax=Stichopus japonicus TaxID=307972 RepID=A0A2G8LHA4_STIJA|nr:putative elongation of very long chain fatty acids protein 7 [Apostichopus japonicus]